VATSITHPERGGWRPALVLTAMALGLQVFLLFHAGGFSSDEAQVINLAASHSPGTMTHDSFPILLPLLLSAWAALDPDGGDPHLRAFGCLVAAGIAGALWLTVWRARRSAPWWSLALFALNGTIIFWEEYLRAYGLGTLLILFVMAAMCFFLERAGWGRAGLLALASGLSTQAMFHNAAFVAAISAGGWLVCWLRKDRSAALKILAASVVGAASLLPYAAIISRWQASTAAIRPGFSLLAATNNLETLLAFPLPQYPWLWIILGAATAGAGIAAWFAAGPAAESAAGRLTEREIRVFAGGVLVFSIIGYLLFLHHAAMITSPWYFVPLTAVLAICFDLGLPPAALPRLLRPAAVAIIVGTAGVSAVFGVRDLNCRFSNMDLVAEHLKRAISAQDYVLVTPWYLGVPFQRYYQAAAPWGTIPPMPDYSCARYDLLPASEEAMARAAQPVMDHMSRTLREGHNVWVVGWMRVPDRGRTPATPVGRLLIEHSRVFEQVDLKIKGQTSDYGDFSLLEASGWKASPSE
jgi:hypothetical protein